MQKPPADEALLLVFATSMRGTFLNVLECAVGSKETAGACFYASGLLAEVITRFSRAKATVRGGGGNELDGGYRDAQCVMHGHYWVEASDPDHGDWVLDITCDQFGGPSVFVAPLERARISHVPGNQVTIDRHVAQDWATLLPPST